MNDLINKTVTYVRPTAILLSVALTVWFPEVRAGALTNTAVTRNQFAAAFDVMKPVVPFASFTFKPPGSNEAPGSISSEVFPGLGANLGIDAYVYQILAPGMTAINDFFISDFSNKLTTATINNNKVSSIYINAGVGAGAMAIDKFTTLGAGAPFDVFQANNPLTGLLVTYKDAFGGAAIPAGTTAYIVGAFSKIPPNQKNLSSILINNNIGLNKAVYSAVPEPSSWGLLGSGLIALVGLCHVRRRGHS
jgi:PEP-CTERM motif